MASSLDPQSTPPGVHRHGVRPVSVSIYWRSDGWQRARQAFIGDLRTQSDAPSTLLDWIVAALEAHASRSVSERRDIRSTIPRDSSPPARRVHWVSPDTVNRLDAARGDDLHGGDVVSRSEFAREAIEVAAQRTEGRLGRLPAAPRRLPTGRPPRLATPKP